MSEKCWSHNREEFSDDFDYHVEEVFNAFLDDNEDFVGVCELEIFEADKKPYSATQFVPCITESMAEQAYEEDFESSESWIDNIALYEKELQALVENVVEKFCAENGLEPNFYGVENVESRMIKIKVDKNGEWEILDNE